MVIYFTIAMIQTSELGRESQAPDGVDILIIHQMGFSSSLSETWYFVFYQAPDALIIQKSVRIAEEHLR